jgi:hypothetical protein
LYENDLKSSKAQYNVTLKPTVECTAKVCLQQKQFSGVISTQSMFYNHIHLSTLCLNYLPGCFLQVNHFSGEANLFKSKWHLILGTNCFAIYIFFNLKIFLFNYWRIIQRHFLWCPWPQFESRRTENAWTMRVRWWRFHRLRTKRWKCIRCTWNGATTFVRMEFVQSEMVLN